MVHGASSDAYWSVAKRRVDDVVKLAGANVHYCAPQVFDEVEHARLIDAAVATHPDGLAISIPDADALRKSVKSALAAGIPVGNLDSGEKEGQAMGVTLYVGTTSEYDAGVKAGERLGKQGIRKVVWVNREVGNISLDQRCQGINDGLAKTGGRSEVVAVGQDSEDAFRCVQAYLSTHPDTQAVFASGTASANALIKLFRDQEIFGKIGLYTFDVGPEILEFDGRRRDGIRHGRPAIPRRLPARGLPCRARYPRLLAAERHLHWAAVYRYAREAKQMHTLSKEGIR